MEMSGQYHSPATLPPKTPKINIERSVSAFRDCPGIFGEQKNLFLLPGFGLWIVQLVA
jgi:hypothetical protein